MLVNVLLAGNCFHDKLKHSEFFSLSVGNKNQRNATKKYRNTWVKW